MSSIRAPLHMLSLDAAGSSLHLCLATIIEQGAPQFLCAERVGPKSHDESLAALFDELLQRSGISPQSLSAVVVGEGPGSFTGLRIGYAFAKGLSYALHCPLVPVSSHLGAACGEALLRAEQGHSIPESMVVVSSAGKEQVIVTRVCCTPAPVIEAESAMLVVGEFLALYGREASLDKGTSAFIAIDEGVPMMCPQVSWRLARMVARGLLEGMVPFRTHKTTAPELVAAKWRECLEIAPFSLLKLSDLAPNYVRSAAAKTIEERRSGK